MERPPRETSRYFNIRAPVENIEESDDPSVPRHVEGVAEHVGNPPIGQPAFVYIPLKIIM